MATNADWTVVFDDRVIINQSVTEMIQNIKHGLKQI